MNQRALESFNDVAKLIGEEKHKHRECTINLFARHQIWLATSSNIDSPAAKKTRSWYILNPEAGLGKVLAAPISRSYINGVPIDIGKNFMMYIRPEMSTVMSPSLFVRYLGVATEETQNLVEKLLRFLYLGDRSVLPEIETIKQQYRAQHKNLSEKKDNLSANYIATMDFDSHGNVNAARLMERIRSTNLGEQMDIRDFYLANILASTEMFSEDGAPLTRHYSKQTIYNDRSQTMQAQYHETMSQPVPEKQENEVMSESEEEVLNENDTSPKKKRRIYLKDLNKEELRFIKNYKNAEVIKQLFGFGSTSSIYRARSLMKEDFSIINDKPDIDPYQVKRIYSKMQNSSRSPYDMIKDLDQTEIVSLRTFVCCLANGRYSGMNSVFGANKDYAIKRVSEEISTWYDVNE